ncbi:MAG: BMP family ABC transporter substrate-binding protein [Anaerolineae bacterium]|nr:BMP family ABC transporter substrate-binding protein [Anaerolineae bacterium]
MRKSIFILVSLIVILTLVLTACGQAGGGKFKACQVTDTGGIDDKSFNATAWKGVEEAVAEFDIEGKYLESQQQTDYDKNITQFIQEDCGIIITVGFLLGDATQKYAEQNPEVPFTIVDFAYDPTISNVLGQVFNTDEAAFLAGYLAASQTETGKIGTWGGIAIPPVTVFMDGFLAGANYYNQQKGASVEVLGWDGAEGLFINNFESAEDGKKASESLADEGADILLPVAGPAGLGAAAVAKERGLKVIGVDADWYDTAPEYQDYILSSVLKNMNVTTKDAIKQAIDGNFEGGVIVGTLENGGVGLAPLHNFEDKVSAEVKAELETLSKEIAAGNIKVADYLK